MAKPAKAKRAPAAPLRRSAETKSRAPAAAGAAARGTPKVVGAVDGAIRILRHLARAGEPSGVSRIAKVTELNTSTAFNILRTLALHDLVRFDEQSKTYALSLGIMDIARGATAFGGDIEMARPALERIALAHGVTVTLWQPVSRDRKVLVLSALTRNAMRIQMAVGQRLPILTGATGRIFAAFGGYSDRELEQRFNEIRWNKPLSFAEFKAQVQEAKEAGWSLDDGNFASGTISLAAPVLGSDGHASLAVTATMFTGQYTTAQAEKIVRDLQEFAADAQRFVKA